MRPFRQATITLGEPIDAQELGYTKSTNRAPREVSDRLMADIARLCAEDHVDSYAPIPI